MSERNPDSEPLPSFERWDEVQMRADALYWNIRENARRAILRAKVERAKGHRLRARSWTNSALDWHALSLEVPRRARG